MVPSLLILFLSFFFFSSSCSLSRSNMPWVILWGWDCPLENCCRFCGFKNSFLHLHRMSSSSSHLWRPECSPSLLLWPSFFISKCQGFNKPTFKCLPLDCSNLKRPCVPFPFLGCEFLSWILFKLFVSYVAITIFVDW